MNLPSNLEFAVRPANPDERGVCENLLQLYMYDFSEFAGGVVGGDGRFHYHDDFGERWGMPWFNPILLTVLDEEPRDRITAWRPAGFAFVANLSNFDQPAAPGQWLMDDFFCHAQVPPHRSRDDAGALVLRRLSRPLGSGRDGPEQGCPGLLAQGDRRLHERPL